MLNLFVTFVALYNFSRGKLRYVIILDNKLFEVYKESNSYVFDMRKGLLLLPRRENLKHEWYA